jgi:hypothetical protein
MAKEYPILDFTVTVVLNYQRLSKMTLTENHMRNLYPEIKLYKTFVPLACNLRSMWQYQNPGSYLCLG